MRTSLCLLFEARLQKGIKSPLCLLAACDHFKLANCQVVRNPLCNRCSWHVCSGRMLRRLSSGGAAAPATWLHMSRTRGDHGKGLHFPLCVQVDHKTGSGPKTVPNISPGSSQQKDLKSIQKESKSIKSYTMKICNRQTLMFQDGSTRITKQHCMKLHFLVVTTKCYYLFILFAESIPYFKCST